MAVGLLPGGMAKASAARLAALNPWPQGVTGPYWTVGPAGTPVVNRVFFSPTPPPLPELYDVWIQTP